MLHCKVYKIILRYVDNYKSTTIIQSSQQGTKMQNVQQNIKDYETAKAEVLAHCMCFKLIEDTNRFMVWFPLGFAVEGAQMRFSELGVTKTKALQLLIVTMEKYWKIG